MHDLFDENIILMCCCYIFLLKKRSGFISGDLENEFNNVLCLLCLILHDLTAP